MSASSSSHPSFFARFMVLRSAIRELWVVYGMKVLEILAYAMMNSTLVLWLSSDLGYSDQQAGFIVATFASLIAFFTVLVGSFTDAVGLRKAFLLGFVVTLISRVVMTGATTRWIAIGLGIIPLSLGLALLTPVMTAAVKKYSTIAQRTMAFSIYYTMMNVGFAIAGWLFDFIRTRLGEYGHVTLPIIHADLSTYRVLFLLSALFTIPGLLVVYFGIREGAEATEDGLKIAPPDRTHAHRPLFEALWHISKDTLQKTVHIFADLWKQPAFYRFLIFLSFVTCVKLVFYHMHYTYPKFGIRELGQGAPIGRLWGVLNPVLIIILVPIVGAVSQRISAYRMIATGTVIAAISMFVMALPSIWFQPIADGWLGNLVAHIWLGVQGQVNPLYAQLTIAFAILSVGEAIYSPRVYEYSVAIAPKGQEASYMALSILPFFLAKLVVGTLSGFLLAQYCPAEGPRNSQMLWLVIAMMTAVGPIGILALRKIIQVHEDGRD